MPDTGDCFLPEPLRLILAATLVIPVLAVILIVTGWGLSSPLVPVVLAIIVAYIAACLIDYFVKSRTAKIAVASVAALASLAIGYLLIRSMTMVCDPVHEPGGIVCDPVHVPETPPTVPPVIATTVPPVETTPMIFDPVHEPGTCSSACDAAAASVPSDAVAAKLEECLRSCGRL